jgi:hypothetical protein
MAKQSTALVPVPSFAETMELAREMQKSNLFGELRNAGQALVKILAGRELGFGPVASLIDVHFIEGKPSIGSHLKAAAIKSSEKYDYDIVVSDDTTCELLFWERRLAKGGETRKGVPGWVELSPRIRLTLAEAKAKGWTNTSKGPKATWLKTPADMLFARCVSIGYRRHCPDLTRGVLVYDPDELDAEPAQAAETPAEDAEFTPAGPRSETPATNGHAEPPPRESVKQREPAPPEPTLALLTPDQDIEINRLVTKLGMTAAAFKGRLKDLYGVEDRTLLSGEQACELIGRLKLRAKEPA